MATRVETTLAASAVDAAHVLRVAGISLQFPRTYGSTDVLDGIDLTIGEGECVGLVGESGSGKSLLGLTVMGLQPRGAVVRGAVEFRGLDLLTTKERTLRQLRGRELAMIYQDALTSLNPAHSVKRTLSDVCEDDSSYTPAELLELVALRGTDRLLRAYPHELSGGQRQRVLIALALARNPALVVADEPTTALDVTVQAQIVALLRRLRREIGFSLLLISHDFGLVAQLADRIAVMYAGQLVESRPTRELISHGRHPYTEGLLSARVSLERREALRVIPGSVPSPRRFPSGCRFRNRCPRALTECATPPERVRDGLGELACFNPERGAAR